MNDPIRENTNILIGESVRMSRANVQNARASLFTPADTRLNAGEMFESFIKKRQWALPFQSVALRQSLLKDSSIHWDCASVTPIEGI